MSGFPDSNAELLSIFPGDSEMAGRMRSFDWSKTPLGFPETWPQNLRIALGICLTSRFPMHIWWGPSLTLLYNDAYIPFLGRSKHPAALGRSGHEVWAELWHQIGPMAERVFKDGIASWSEDILMFFDRDLPQEEVYVTFSFSPVFGEDHRVDGMYCAVTDTTEKIVGSRRLDTLHTLGVEATVARSVAGACKAIGDALGENKDDLPFAGVYLMEESEGVARLAAKAGPSEGGWQLPETVSLADDEKQHRLPLVSVLKTKKTTEADLDKIGLELHADPWPEPLKKVMVLPLRATGHDSLAGLLVAGASARRPLDTSYSAFFDLVAGHIATAITDARAYEEERKRAEELAELDRVKTAFFSNVSHEFRTPLTLMLGPLEETLAQSDGLSATQRERLEIAYRNSLRLLRLVNTLLDFSRIEAGRIEAVFEPTDLGTLTAELASVFRSAIEKAGLRLIVKCPPLPQPVYVDREMWEKIVLNLISNAFKFTFEGRITVSLRSRNTYAELSIKDTGVGIPESELPRIFERFRRVKDRPSRTHEGTGIGLALVQEFVKLHGGEIKVKSAEGSGTTFTVSLPLGTAHLPKERIGASRTLASTASGTLPFVEEALRWLPAFEGSGERAEKGKADRRAASLSPAGPPGGDPARILLADDNADMRDYLRRLLAARYRVVAVADGEAAFAAIHEHRPDLVLADVMMPRLDGYGLVRRLRADPRTSTLPIILLSARAGEESRVEGLQQGADDYLVKPFSARELFARIHTRLELAGARKAAEEALRDSNEELEQRVRERTSELEEMNKVLRKSEQDLAAELEAEQRLQCVSTELLYEDNVQALYEKIIDAVVRITGSDYASIQAFRPEHGSGELQLLASRGFSPEAAKFWEWVGTDSSGSTCGAALRTGKRAIVPDVEKCDYMQGSGDLAMFLQSGIRACQTTPLFSRTGKMLGMISTHWREPHEPSKRDLRLLDVLARQAADLIERKQMEEELRLSRDELELRVRERTTELEKERCRFYEVLETLPVMICLLTPDHRVVFVNRAFRDRFGECRGRRCYGYLFGQEEPCQFCETFKVLETGEPYRWERKTPDGCVINAYDFPLTDVDGSPLVLEMGIDITEQRRAEEDRVRLEEQLRQAHKMEAIGTLAGGIAHDFNNLLAVIIGNTELALDEVADEDNIRHNLMQIFKASKRGRDLVKQILQFSRKSDKQRKPTDIVPLVKETFRLLRSSIPASVEMKLDLLTDAAATFADPSEVQQILMNLGNNAEHAMREHGGTLAFGVEEKTYLPDDHVPVSDMDSGTYVVVSVRDTGAGMTAETRKRVFDPFFTTKEVGEGTGMGLATVFALVRDLNGEITVSSKLGKGSTFHIFLPKANTEKQDHDERHTDSLKGGKESILLVDDEEALTESNRAMLERLGYQVTATTDSKEALELFSGDPMRYDVVITDQAMPHITGIRLAEKMLKIRRDVRVILCTGYSHTASPEKAKTVGISEFLMKPITKKQLAAAVRRVLDGRHDR